MNMVVNVPGGGTEDEETEDGVWDPPAVNVPKVPKASDETVDADWVAIAVKLAVLTFPNGPDFPECLSSEL